MAISMSKHPSTSDKIGKEAAQDYERHVKGFSKSPISEAAARDARRAVEGPEGTSLHEAEREGKSHSAGEDREAMVPSWLTERQQSSWQRVKSALRRDWEQTVHHFAPNRAPHLDQHAGDTVKQALGMKDVPPGEAPNPPDISWDEAEPAVRLGHVATSQYPEHKEWDDELEHKLRGDWKSMGPRSSWEQVGHHVRYGWHYRDRGRDH